MLVLRSPWLGLSPRLTPSAVWTVVWCPRGAHDFSSHKAHPGQHTAQTLKDSWLRRYIHGVRPDGPATWILKVGVRHSTGALACMRETR